MFLREKTKEVQKIKTYYEEGLISFEKLQYKDAMENFVCAYGENSHKEEIMQLVTDCFWTSNLEELKQTYQTNSKGITQIEYEELPLACIPISDELFYLYDMETEEFCGTVDLTLPNYWELGVGLESVLAADCWDCRQINEMVGEKFPSCIYVRPDDEGRYVSFFQIPGFAEKFMRNHVMMNSDELMELYFREMKDVYLPKEIVSKRNEYYQEILEKIHRERVEAPRAERNNIFVSVCIPSINRGGEALRAVKVLLESEYDAEIEIIVSNNGSTENTEGYDIIRNMKDSRIVYHEFKENRYLIGNITKVLELARGKYVVVQSDQDTMMVSQLKNYLGDLARFPGIGAGISRGRGGNFPQENVEGLCWDKVSNICSALGRNYITGIWYNMEKLRKRETFARKEEYGENLFVKQYPHIFYLLIALGEDDLYVGAVDLWEEGSDSREAQTRKATYDSVVQLSQRMKQCEGAIDIIERIYELRDREFAQMFENRISTVYRLMKMAFFYYNDEFKIQKQNWKDICDEISAWANQLIDSHTNKMFSNTVPLLRKSCMCIHSTNYNDNWEILQ